MWITLRSSWRAQIQGSQDPQETHYLRVLVVGLRTDSPLSDRIWPLRLCNGMIRLGLYSTFRIEPMKFRATTGAAVKKLRRHERLAKPFAILPRTVIPGSGLVLGAWQGRE